jgi:hypothetical protein
MATAKEVVLRLLENLPDDCTLDEIQYRIYVRPRIEEARQEIRGGQFYALHPPSLRRALGVCRNELVELRLLVEGTWRPGGGIALAFLSFR